MSEFYTLLLMHDPQGMEPVPCICYNHRSPMLSGSKAVVEEHAENLRKYNPGVVYKVFKLVEVE